jgi:hypothetical protein
MTRSGPALSALGTTDPAPSPSGLFSTVDGGTAGSIARRVAIRAPQYRATVMSAIGTKRTCTSAPPMSVSRSGHPFLQRALAESTLSCWITSLQKFPEVEKQQEAGSSGTEEDRQHHPRYLDINPRRGTPLFDFISQTLGTTCQMTH